MMVSIKEVTRGDYFIPISNLMQYQRSINKKLCKKLTILVVIICVEGDSALREFLIAATQEGMDSEEYVYISIEGRRGGTFREISSLQAKKYVFFKSGNVWNDPTIIQLDGREDLALRGARRLLSVILSALYAESLKINYSVFSFACR